jgi:hypothetical protein
MVISLFVSAIYRQEKNTILDKTRFLSSLKSNEINVSARGKRRTSGHFAPFLQEHRPEINRWGGHLGLESFRKR